MLEVRVEAIGWERESLPCGTRARSDSVLSTIGLQYAIQGRAHKVVNFTQMSELGEMREL